MSHIICCDMSGFSTTDLKPRKPIDPNLTYKGPGYFTSAGFLLIEQRPHRGRGDAVQKHLLDACHAEAILATVLFVQRRRV